MSEAKPCFAWVHIHCRSSRFLMPNSRFLVHFIDTCYLPSAETDWWMESRVKEKLTLNCDYHITLITLHTSCWLSVFNTCVGSYLRHSLVLYKTLTDICVYCTCSSQRTWIINGDCECRRSVSMENNYSKRFVLCCYAVFAQSAKSKLIIMVTH